jgi:hypothetical protein
MRMSLSDDAAARIVDYLSELQKAGVDPKQFAAFLRNVTGGGDTVPDGGDDNAPGFGYASRVSTAAFRALSSHGEEMNRAWCEIRQGRYGVGTAMKSWARVTETYVGVLAEAWRGPQLPSPSWLFIAFSKSDESVVMHYSIRVDDVLPAGTLLDSSEFEPVGGSGGVVAATLYADPPKVVASRIEFVLDEDRLRALTDGTTYIAFIVRKGAGAVPPLAVVLIRVTR